MTEKLGKRRARFPGGRHPETGIVYPILRGFYTQARKKSRKR